MKSRIRWKCSETATDVQYTAHSSDIVVGSCPSQVISILFEALVVQSVLACNCYEDSTQESDIIKYFSLCYEMAALDTMPDLGI